MNNKQYKILKNIYKKPTCPNIRWKEVESLFKALGATMTQGQGSRIKVTLNGKVKTFHKPHTKPEIKKSVVKEIRNFL